MKQDDNDTGCESYPGNLDKDCTFTWDDTFNFVASLNAANHAGGGWRVPNVKELQSIVNYQNFLPAGSEAFHDTEGEGECVAGCTVDACSCTAASSLYWSSTSYAFAPVDAWLVDFASGDVFDGSKGNGRRVRAVRGGR